MAPSRKRKRDARGGHGDGDDDDARGMRQILPVANLPIDFDDEPMDGMQYLFTVRRDARKLPDIKRVDNPYACDPPQPAQAATAEPAEPTERVEGSPPLPNKAWRGEFERHFRHFRANMSRLTAQPRGAGPLQKVIPDRKNRDAWWAFLEGAPESVWNPSRPTEQGRKRGVENHEASEQSPSVTPSDDDTPQKPRELTPMQLFYIDHRLSLHLITYFTHWFNLYLKSKSMDADTASDGVNSAPTHIPTDVHMRWIFALLTRIDLLCSADEMNSLRSLARTCLALIAIVRRRKAGTPLPSARSTHSELTDTKDPDSSGTGTCATPLNYEGDSKTLSECSMWMVFCAVTCIWGQRDLWNDAEETLR